jgi:hypothetical protein
VAYVLQAVLAPDRVLAAFAEGSAAARCVPLRGGYGLVPLTAEVLAELAPPEAREPPQVWAATEFPLIGEQPLPGPLLDALIEASRQGPIAYVEAEFFGGDGLQACVVCLNGSVTLGPLVVDSVDSDDLPINRALRSLGVDVGRERHDELGWIGLDRARRTEDWLDDGARPTD